MFKTEYAVKTGDAFRILLARALLAAISLICLGSFCSGEDLAKHYSATLLPTGQPRGYEWTCEKEDAWRLKSFSVKHADELLIELGESQVLFGHHNRDVLWAVVLPSEPGKIARASDGQNERVTSLWLRFHASRLSELFPSDTVLGHHDNPDIQTAKRIAAHKLRSSYQVRGRPSVVPLHHLIVDCETKEQNRRFFVVDAKSNTAKYVAAFQKRVFAAETAITNEKAGEIFDRVWTTFDRVYAMFAIKPDIDWDQLKEDYRPKAIQTKGNQQLAGVINEMLIELNDLHVHVQCDGTTLAGFHRDRPLNASVQAIEHLVGKTSTEGSGLNWAVTDDNVGYIRVNALSDVATITSFADVLYEMDNTRGLVIDLRFNGGGDEKMAQQMAGHFLDKERTYAMSQYRTGPRRNEISEPRPRRFQPSRDFSYTRPVVVLQGQKTMSSAEAFVLMLRQCPNVTTMGDRTAGSSGNPMRLPCGSGIVVNIPRWNPLDADGKTFDTIGVSPDKPIKAKPREFTATEDPVISAALKHLRAIETDAPKVHTPKGPLSPEIAALWNKVVEVNKPWIDPRPKRLSYSLTGGVVGSDNNHTTSHVWIDGNMARCDTAHVMEVADDPFAGDDPFGGNAAEQKIRTRQSIHLFDSSNQSMVTITEGKRRKQRADAHARKSLNQGITWRTAMHAFAERGLPDNTRIVKRSKQEDHEIVVLEARGKNISSRVGLGLIGVQYGSVGHQIGRVKLHIRLPEHIPVKEEIAGGNLSPREITVHYSERFHRIKNGVAPQWISHRVNRDVGPDLPPMKWYLTATFQIIDDIWLLKSARNSQNGKTKTSLTVENASTGEISKEKFILDEAEEPQK